MKKVSLLKLLSYAAAQLARDNIQLFPLHSKIKEFTASSISSTPMAFPLEMIYSKPYLSDEKTEGQKGEATCPRSHTRKGQR